MTSEIKGFEFELAYDELVGVGVEGGDVGLDAVFFEHVKKGGFTGVVESEKEDFGVFVVEAEGGEGVVEPVDEEHGWILVCVYVG